jgi:hypothetical protein
MTYKVKLRDIIINRLEALAHNRVPLLEEEGRYWGVCFQIDKYLETVLKDPVYIMEEYVLSDSNAYVNWRSQLGEGYVSFHDINSFAGESRRVLCLALMEEIKEDTKLFDEWVELSDYTTGKFYSLGEFNVSFWEEEDS